MRRAAAAVTLWGRHPNQRKGGSATSLAGRAWRAAGPLHWPPRDGAATGGPRGGATVPLPPAQPPLSPGPSAYIDPEAHRSYIDPALIDSFGRRHRYLRVSLTDRCNLRCKYCMPEEGEEFAGTSPGGDLLTTEELAYLIGFFVRLGVRKVRLTGGEPTFRKDFGRIVEDLGKINAGMPEPLSIGITTNGVRLKKFLPQLRAAGVRNVNLSLDTLVAAKWPLLTRRPEAWHTRTVEVLREVASQECFRLKVNCVLLKGINDEEIGDFIDLTEHMPLEVRFLEFMPFDGNSWSEGKMVPQAAIVKAINEHSIGRGHGPAERLPPDSLNDVANLWKVPGWRGRLGVIASMTDAFCSGCNRIRMTSNGELRNCLFGEEGWSLRDALRAGASDEALAVAVSTALRSKFHSLGGKRDMHELRERGALSLPMVALGG